MGDVTFDFKDKVILVTGSASGIGEKTVELFSKSGAKVVIVDIDSNGIKRVAELCENVSPHKYMALEIVADLSQDDDLKRVINETVKHYGQLDVLVNNAGVFLPTRIDNENAIKVYDYTMSVNLRAMYVLVHLAVPHLIKTKGSIINVSSIASTLAAEWNGAYGISKSGIDLLTKNAAIELGPKGIRVNSVNPGHVWTPLVRKVLSDEMQRMTREWVESNCPLRRYGQPEDIANVIMFLASKGAGFVTGANVPVDSGYRNILSGPQTYSDETGAKEKLLGIN